MARYIDVDKFVKDLQSEYHGMISDESLKIYKIIHRLDNEPTADVEEVKHGKWVDRYSEKYDNHLYECSECRGKALYDTRPDELGSIKLTQVLSPACPWCGAKMGE